MDDGRNDEHIYQDRPLRQPTARAGVRPVWLLLTSLLSALLLAVFAQAQAQTIVIERVPRTVGETLAKQARQLGRDYAEYRTLKAERRQEIAQLESELAKCGRCPDAARIQDELSKNRSTESMIAKAEVDAMQSMGLTQFSSFDDMLSAMAKGLASKHDFGTDYTRDKISQVGIDHCRARGTKLDVSALQKCISAFNAPQQLALFRNALSYCQQIRGENFIASCQSAAGCAQFDACMQANSHAVELCADNNAKGYSSPKVNRCFTSLLHPGIFANSGIGSQDRKAEADDRKRQFDARADERRDQSCTRLAAQLERNRAEAQRMPGTRTSRALERNESAYAKNCGG